jgi:probable rRNA maturation factor
MITIKNRTRRIKIDEQWLKSQAQKILNILAYPDFDLGILLTTNASIRVFNRQYRGKDKPTDILSFAFHPTLKAGQRIKVSSEDEKNLGDLIISLEYIYTDPKKMGDTFTKRMQILLVHGICHLLGYDHEKDDEYQVMQAKEQEILKQLH